MNRETWMNMMAAEFAPLFELNRKPLPEKVRIGVGFTQSKKAIGECHYAEGSADGTTEIFIVPGLADPIDVGSVLLHELCHAAMGPGFGHGKEFKALAGQVGLTGKATATVPTEQGRAFIAAAIDTVGPYPHASLLSGTAEDTPKKQKTIVYMNVTCPSCGFKAKVQEGQRHLGSVECPNHACEDHGKPLLAKGEKRDAPITVVVPVVKTLSQTPAAQRARARRRGKLISANDVGRQVEA